MTSDLLNAPKEFLRLFKAGKDAARAGHKAEAHELFRRAVEIDPYHEQVWLWLASVVETEEDRRVCFENVLELNPDNPVARRQLNILEPGALDAAAPFTRIPSKGSRRRRLFRLLVIFLILAAAAAYLVMWRLG